MFKVKKKTGSPVHAYELGAKSAAEAELIALGRIRVLPDGSYELFSREATEGSGQLASPGDFFKIDSTGYPYPNARSFFVENHDRVGEDLYLQRSKVLIAWSTDEPECELVRELIGAGILRINGSDPDKYFEAEMWGAVLTAAKDAVIVFREIYDDISKVKFSFIARDEFEKTYEVIGEAAQ